MTTIHHGALRARATRADRGQAFALLSLFLIAMTGLLGLGVDGGSLYLTRRGMQNAADAAALAGARVMATGDTSGADIRAAIETYAGANYVAAPAQNVTAYYTDGTGARVGTVTAATPTGLNGKASLTPSTNNPVQSTVLPDPVNKTPADFYQGTTSTATYHYVNGNTNLASYVTNGVLQPGVYYVNGSINFATG